MSRPPNTDFNRLDSCDSSDVTSLASTDRTLATCRRPLRQDPTIWPSTKPSTYSPIPPDDAKAAALMLTARQLIADLQDLLNAPSPAPTPTDNEGTADEGRLKQEVRLEESKQPVQQTDCRNSGSAGSGASIGGSNQRASSVCAYQQEAPLELQACNGLCVVFANYANFLPASTIGSSSPSPAASGGAELESGTDLDNLTEPAEGSPGQLMARANQIRDAAASIGRLFNSRLEFTVLIHWNKSRREILRQLRQTATSMTEGGRDSCFVFCLGRGGRDHFEATCGGVVTLTDILATLAVGQRGRLPPVFVVGELTSAAAAGVGSSTSSPAGPAANLTATARLSLPSNHLLLWTLDAPEMTDLLVEQLTRTNSSGSYGVGGGSGGGNKDVASIVAGIAEWIRRRRTNETATRMSIGEGQGRATGDVRSAATRSVCCCRFASKLDRLVYLASSDCI